MTSPFRKIISAGLAVMMTATVATSASAALINTEQVKSDIKMGTLKMAEDAADSAKFAIQSQKADGIWSSKLSQNAQTAYMLIVNAMKNYQSSVQIPQITDSDKHQIPNILKREHPELFYYNGQITTKSQTAAGTGHITYTANWTLHSNARQEVNALNQAVNSFVANAPKSGADYDKELFVHDKLVKDTSYVKGQDNVYDALVLHKANCDGYATAMKVVLNKLGVDCEVITGKATGEGAHAWNRVTLNSKQYLTDTCWDDPNATQRSLSHAYFNLTKDEMNRDHTADRPNEQSNCTNTDQNWYRKNGCYYTSVADAEKAIENGMANGKTVELALSTPSQAQQVLSDFSSGKIKLPANSHWSVSSLKRNGTVTNGALVFFPSQA